MTDTEKLQEAIKKSGYKKCFIAEKIGLTPAGFSNCINNRAEFKVSQVNALCELLSIEPDQRESIFFARNGV